VDEVDEDAVAGTLRDKLRFAAEKLAPGKVVALHVEFQDPDAPALLDSHTACGKATHHGWVRCVPEFFAACVNPMGVPLLTFELCERCLRHADAKIWVERYLGWESRIEFKTEEGCTYRWFDEAGNRTCVRHVTDALAKPQDPPNRDLFDGDDGPDDGEFVEVDCPECGGDDPNCDVCGGTGKAMVAASVDGDEPDDGGTDE